MNKLVFERAYPHLLEVINKLYPSYQWISVKDRMPSEKIFNSVFIVTMHSSYKNKTFVEPMHYIGGGWYTMSDEEPLDTVEYEVTHWMPLPSPPEQLK